MDDAQREAEDAIIRVRWQNTGQDWRDIAGQNYHTDMPVMFRLLDQERSTNEELRREIERLTSDIASYQAETAQAREDEKSANGVADKLAEAVRKHHLRAESALTEARSEIDRWRGNCEHHERRANAAESHVAESEENYRAEQVIRYAAERQLAEARSKIERLKTALGKFAELIAESDPLAWIDLGVRAAWQDKAHALWKEYDAALAASPEPTP